MDYLALESNVGLNAIIPQERVTMVGLAGSLYTNNLQSPRLLKERTQVDPTKGYSLPINRQATRLFA